MDLSLTEQQEMLRRTARDFLAGNCTKDYVRRMEEDEKGYSRELWEQMTQLGWMGLVFPEEYGGSGLGFLDLVLLLEEMGGACSPGPFFSTVVLGGLPILHMGTEEQKQELLPRIADGEMIFCFALSEPDVDYELDCVSVTAALDGDCYIINGTKLFVHHAHVADYLICVARDNTSNKQLGLFLIDARTPGINCTSLRTLSADKQYEVTLTNAKVPKQSLLGGQAQSYSEIDRTLQYASVGKCAEMIGGAQQVLDMTVDYAKQRVQFGHQIGSFQAIQHYCANMLIDVTSSRLITYRAASMLSEGIMCAKDVSIAKAWVGEAFRRVCMLAHQVHGAVGITKDHDLQLYTRRAKAAEVILGDADAHREVVATEIGL